MNTDCPSCGARNDATRVTCWKCSVPIVGSVGERPRVAGYGIFMYVLGALSLLGVFMSVIEIDVKAFVVSAVSAVVLFGIGKLMRVVDWIARRVDE
jgi:hypothetical protein